MKQKISHQLRLMESKFKHQCPEWDYLLIDETCKEFEVCTCFQDEMWNEVIAKIAAFDIMSNSKPGDSESITKWKKKVIDSLSSQYLLKKIPEQEAEEEYPQTPK